MAVSGGPGRVSGAAAVWDPHTERVVLHGGMRADGASTRMLAYDGVRWVHLMDSRAGPAPRLDHTLFCVPGRSGVWLHGGESEGARYANVWWTRMPRTASFTPVGAGCLGSGGVPSLEAIALPVVGGDFLVRIRNIPPAMPIALGLLGLSAAQWGAIPLPASLAFFGMPGCTLFVAPDVVHGVLPVLGVADWQYPIPPIASLIGVSLYVQAMTIDPAVPNPQSTFPAVMSNALIGVLGH